jgi:hypothetical protein
MLITSTTMEGWKGYETCSQSGWCAYPLGAVRQIRKI